MDTTNIIFHWIAHFFEAKLTRPRPGQILEVEANILALRSVWPRGLNITVNDRSVQKILSD